MNPDNIEEIVADVRAHGSTWMCGDLPYATLVERVGDGPSVRIVRYRRSLAGTWNIVSEDVV